LVEGPLSARLWRKRCGAKPVMKSRGHLLPMAGIAPESRRQR
jgi:hypothetical protein